MKLKVKYDWLDAPQGRRIVTATYTKTTGVTITGQYLGDPKAVAWAKGRATEMIEADLFGEARTTSNELWRALTRLAGRLDGSFNEDVRELFGLIDTLKAAMRPEWEEDKTLPGDRSARRADRPILIVTQAADGPQEETTQ